MVTCFPPEHPEPIHPGCRASSSRQAAGLSAMWTSWMCASASMMRRAAVPTSAEHCRIEPQLAAHHRLEQPGEAARLDAFAELLRTPRLNGHATTGGLDVPRLPAAPLQRDA